MVAYGDLSIVNSRQLSALREGMCACLPTYAHTNPCAKIKMYSPTQSDLTICLTA